MNKKIKILVISLMILLFQTGCGKLDATLTIKEDGSVDYSYFLGIQKEYVTNDDSLLTEDQKKEYKQAGISAQDYEDDDYKGIKLSVNYVSIDDLTSLAETSCDYDIYNKKISNMYCFKKERGFFGDIYTAKIAVKPLKDNLNNSTMEDDEYQYTATIDHKEEVENDDGTVTITNYYSDGSTSTVNTTKDSLDNNTMAEMIKKQFKTSFTVNLPTKNISNNAFTISNDGKTLSWDLMDARIDDIEYFEFTFEKPNKTVIIISISFGVVIAFLVISIIISKIVTRNNKKEEPIETLDETTTTVITTVENTEKVSALLSADGSDVNNLDKKN